MKVLLYWLVLTLAVLGAAYVIPGIEVSGFVTAIIAAAVLAFVNTIIKPIIVLLTLPLNILTLGLFTLVINALFFWFVAELISGFTVENFKAAFFGALIVSIISFLGNRILRVGQK